MRLRFSMVHVDGASMRQADRVPDPVTNNLFSLENLALRRRPLCGIAATLSQKPTAFRLI